MGLRTYRKKRDFARTPEPRGAATPRGDGRSYVIQKHAARRLHHDFRLELDGVLLSWAVPKGPPVEPGAKSLAVRTEDHPLEYGSFEGVIPKGEYGGGTVMLWDRGSWEPDGDPHRMLRAGKLDFALHGERLRGRWSLVRMRGTERETAENWLLIKRTDADAGGEAHAAAPTLDSSVASGRSMAQIAAAGDRTWTAAGEVASGGDGAGGKGGADGAHVGAPVLDAANVPGARRAALPKTFAPQLATLVDRAPDGDGWLHEIKFDGYRLVALRDGARVRLLTRTGQDWTARFPTVAAAVAALPVERAVLDGEVVVLRPDGVSDFQALQNSLEGGDASRLVCYVFDLPFCDGFDLTRSPLRERKRLLQRLVGARTAGALRVSEHIEGNGPAFFEQACAARLEGIVSKRADSRYEHKRSRTWVKTKCLLRQEFVVGGLTEPEGSRTHFGALLVGVHDDDGALHYAGKVGTGFTAASLAELAARFAPLRVESSPFVDPPRGAEGRRARWVRPECVVEVAFTEWTKDGRLRHPSFQGVREDKDPRTIVRERAQPAAAAKTRPAKTQVANAKAAKTQPRKTLPAATKAAKSAAAPSDDAGDDVVAGVRISHPDRVLWPDEGITKLELARYYERVADHLLPHLVDRPVTIVRCPQGRSQKCFYQKHVTEALPAPVRSIAVPEKGGTGQYIGVDDLAGVITLVQFGVLELHPWGSRADRLDRPDRLVLDLDPGPDVPWAKVVAAALRLRELCEALGLQSFPRTTGGKGLHVVVPIERRTGWPEAKQFAFDLVSRLADTDRSAFVLTMTKSKRQGRIFLDYLRNDQGSTAITNLSSRAREGAPVATPLRWDEVTAELDPRSFTVRTVPERLAAVGDAWRGFFDVRQSLTAAIRKAVRR